MEIRKLESTDAAAFRRVRLAGLHESPAAFGQTAEEFAALPEDEIAGRLAPATDRVVLGAFEGDELVGVAGLRRETGTRASHKARVWGVYVVPQCRGAGVGRQLMSALIAESRSLNGVNLLLLAVNGSQRAAVALYAAAGFRSYGTEPRALSCDAGYADEVLMCLDLLAPPSGVQPATENHHQLVPPKDSPKT